MIARYIGGVGGTIVGLWKELTHNCPSRPGRLNGGGGGRHDQGLWQRSVLKSTIY